MWVRPVLTRLSAPSGQPLQQTIVCYFIASMDEDKDPIAKALDAQGAFQMTAWTLRLAEHGAFEWLFTADPHLFALFYATCATAVPAPQQLAGATEPAQAVSDKLLPTLRDLRRQFDHETSGRFARLYLQGTSVYPIAERSDGAYRRGVRAWRESAEEKASERFTSQEQNIEWVADLLSLEALERKLLIFQLNRHRPGFEQLFDLLADSDRPLAGVLAAAFGATERDVLAALSEKSKLVLSGLLDVEERPLHIGHPSSHLRATLTEAADDEADFLSRFVKRLTPSPSMASLARLHEDDRRILAGILRSKMPTERGLHVLVHGPKSVDKRDMIATLMQDEGIDGYAVVTKRVPSSDLPTWVYLAQRHLERTGPEAVLVIDRAHDALDSRHDTVFRILGLDDDDDADGESGRASDDGLTSGSVRCVWLTDRAKMLSERNLGAFLFHCEALPGSRSDRRKRVSTLARAEWAVMQVNEVLQRMERFEGIFIAATNLMDSLDIAAMRRFTWKLEFKALAPEQAWSMFCAETGFDGDADRELAARLKQQLSAIADLAPGDFATVKRQANMLDEQLSPSGWLEQLKAEANAKMAGLRRQKLGFAA